MTGHPSPTEATPPAYSELEGRVALVTGGARGLGAATASLLAENGATVIINDLNNDAVESAVASLGPQHRGIAASVADEDAVNHMIGSIMHQFGRLDVVVNNAGVFEDFIPTVDQTYAYYRSIMQVHLDGTYLVSKAAARPMIDAGRGAIVNTSSIGGILGLPVRTAYSSAKAGISMMTRVLGCEWAPHGLRVNAVAPGYVDSRTAASASVATHVDVSAVKRRTPMGRVGEPRDVAEAVLFLASDRAKFITGVTLPVDGGYMAFGAPSDANSTI